MKRYLFIALLLFVSSGLMFSFIWSEQGKTENYRYHPENYLADPLEINELPYEANTLFSGSGNCILCHGDPSQFPSSDANQDADGNDISPVTTWRATMMANAAKDPFWRAKVSHEGLVNPELKDEIENVCTKCHSPNGHFEAIHLGQLPYTMEDVIADPMALDGVSCTSCHTMTDEGFGSVFSANITYDVNKKAYGPYTFPDTDIMNSFTGFTPTYGAHISTSQQCGMCHTLITHPLDTAGNPTGTSFVEQAIYHEWLNSDFSQEGTSCQDCHMNKIEETTLVSPLPMDLSPRSEFSEHDIVGGNVFMLNLFKNNISALGLNATTSQFNKVISSTEEMLESSLEINIAMVEWTDEGMYFEVELINKSGHKLPSGYPSRQMYIDFLAYSGADTIFHSGSIDAEGRIFGEPANEYEHHYDTITSEDQVQIYELAMGDMYDSLTTILEYAYQPLKDNRIPPKGFLTSHYSYDTIPIIGDATEDLNFNNDIDGEGTGRDVVTYFISYNQFEGYSNYFVDVKVKYLSIPRKWLDEMFEHESADIDAFKNMYDAADGTPFTIKDQEIFVNVESVDEHSKPSFIVYPNPVIDVVNIKAEDPIKLIEVFDNSGKLVERIDADKRTELKLNLSGVSGIYSIKVTNVDGTESVEKVIKK